MAGMNIPSETAIREFLSTKGYTMKGMLGQGEFGGVWHATHPIHGNVAIKAATTAIHGKSKSKKMKVSLAAICMASERQAYQLWLRLAAMTIKNTVKYPTVPRYVHIPAMLDSWPGNSGTAITGIVLPLLGRDLHSVFHEYHSLSDHDVALVGLQIAYALEYVHSRGVIYLDIKPGNCMFGLDSNPTEAGKLYLVDFGCATRAASLGHIQAAGQTGTPRYMSTFVHDGAQLSPRMDAQALVFMLIEIAGGQLPWETAQSMEEAAELKASSTSADCVAGVPSTAMRAVLRRALDITRGMPEKQTLREAGLFDLFEPLASMDKLTWDWQSGGRKPGRAAGAGAAAAANPVQPKRGKKAATKTAAPAPAPAPPKAGTKRSRAAAAAKPAKSSTASESTSDDSHAPARRSTREAASVAAKAISQVRSSASSDEPAAPSAQQLPVWLMRSNTHKLATLLERKHITQELHDTVLQAQAAAGESELRTSAASSSPSSSSASSISSAASTTSASSSNSGNRAGHSETENGSDSTGHESSSDDDASAGSGRSCSSSSSVDEFDVSQGSDASASEASTSDQYSDSEPDSSSSEGDSNDDGASVSSGELALPSPPRMAPSESSDAASPLRGVVVLGPKRAESRKRRTLCGFVSTMAQRFSSS